MARKPFTAVSRFRAEKAFFINGFKVRGLPWIECRLDKFLKLPNKTVLVAVEVIHVSKYGLWLTDRIILHYKDDILSTYLLQLAGTWPKSR
ncbi:MAG: hypothetical protein R6U35_04240 [Candidatus Humimicrobiaceae bacterium]